MTELPISRYTIWTNRVTAMVRTSTNDRDTAWHRIRRATLNPATQAVVLSDRTTGITLVFFPKA